MEHHRARDRGDDAATDVATDRIRAVDGFLRANHRPDLIVPLTMEWVNEGRDAAEFVRWRDMVDQLMAGHSE